MDFRTFILNSSTNLRALNEKVAPTIYVKTSDYELNWLFI